MCPSTVQECGCEWDGVSECVELSYLGKRRKEDLATEAISIILNAVSV